MPILWEPHAGGCTFLPELRACKSGIRKQSAARTYALGADPDAASSRLFPEPFACSDPGSGELHSASFAGRPIPIPDGGGGRDAARPDGGLVARIDRLYLVLGDRAHVRW